MLTTAIAVLAAVALLLPGFIVAELSLARGARASRSDLELALRALSYALIVHLAFGWWTGSLVKRVGPTDEWTQHVGAVSLYVLVVLVLVPVGLGLLVNWTIARVEKDEGPPPLWAAALGAGQARDAYDFAFQRVSDEGAWVIVELVGHSPAEPRIVGGRYGRASAVGQTPSDHDIYLEQLCVVVEGEDGLRRIVAPRNLREVSTCRQVRSPGSKFCRLAQLTFRHEHQVDVPYPGGCAQRAGHTGPACRDEARADLSISQQRKAVL